MVESQNQIERHQLVRGGLTIERTLDRSIIWKLATHPRIWPHITDDVISDPKAWTPPQSESIRYLVAREPFPEEPCGLGVFMARTWVCWDAHVAFLPRAYGGDARNGFKRMIAWMWENTTARRITGEIVRENTLAIRFARSCGFEPYGINRKSYLRGGVLHDQLCLGISKP